MSAAKRGLQRGLLIVAILAAIGVAGLVAMQWLLPHGEQQSGSGQVSIGGPFTLTDQDGRTVSDRDYAGKFMLVYFGFTHCPDICPTGLQTIAIAMDGLGADAARVQPILISVDPERDTPPVMKEYAGLPRPPGRPDRHAGADRQGGPRIPGLLPEGAAEGVQPGLFGGPFRLHLSDGRPGAVSDAFPS